MLYRRLGKTELNVSVIGFGASPLGNVFDDCDESEGIRSVHCAIDLGINFLMLLLFMASRWPKRVWAMPSRESEMTYCWQPNVDGMD